MRRTQNQRNLIRKITKTSSKFRQQHRQQSSSISSKSRIEDDYEGSTKIDDENEYCYRQQSNWVKKRKLNISMWLERSIFSCHGISINFLLSKEEIEEDLSLIREGSSPVNN
ncbi:hypothetical protein HHI36_009752 [Cryptolaemus montrouzieri]|uniref:Uncharacterized protein n=1 Tax=Cryptolaemus montrouzieri TaxID=559131 RepID=A0ABD2MGT3_9CUCU